MESSTAFTLVFIAFAVGIVLGYKDGKRYGISLGQNQLKSCQSWKNHNLKTHLKGE